MLSLILMKSLNLYVKNGVRINFNTIVLKNVFCKTLFILEFNVHKFLKSLLIISVYLQLSNLGKICDPVWSNMVCDPCSKVLVSVKKETSLSDTISFVIKLLRHHLIEVFQFLIFQNLCMKSCNTIYREACNDCKVSHFNLSVIDDCHLFDLLIVSRISVLYFDDETTVNLFDDLIYTRKKSGEQLDRPFLKSLCHNGMVSVSNTLGSYRPCIIPAKAFLIHEDSHKLCNSHSRMSIIHLEYNLLVKLLDIIMCLFVFLNCSLNTCRYKEVLLFQTKLFTGHFIIVRVKYVYNILCKVLLLNSFLVITFIKGIKSKLFNSSCIPDTQCIYYIILVSNDRHIVWNSLYSLISFMDEFVLTCSLVIFNSYISAEMYLFSILRTTKLKWIAFLKPCIRNLNLISVSDFLFEHTITVTDSTAVCTISKCCKGVKEACCKSSQTTVSKCRIRFLILKRIDVNSQLFKSFLYLTICTKV